LAIERRNGKETEGKLIGRVIALIGLFKQQGKGKGDGGNRGCGGRPAKQRRRRKEGGGRKLTGGTQQSARAKKRKKREMAWTGAGKGWWAAGPLGPKGKKGLLFLFFFLFQTPFKTTFLFKFKPNSFNVFLKNL
jgi:hypothetical protein